MADGCLPLKAIHHVELLVGNAKQAAYFYRHAFGFSQLAYAGPETGVKEQASYVLYQGSIRLVDRGVMTARRQPVAQLLDTACARVMCHPIVAKPLSRTLCEKGH